MIFWWTQGGAPPPPEVVKVTPQIHSQAVPRASRW
jgi:hypothetical protein